MKLTIKTSFLLLILGLSSCQTENPNQTNQDEASESTTPIDSINNSMLYTCDAKDIKVNWTARKHTNEAKVEGWFDSIVINGFTEASNVVDAMNNVSFKIFTSSINTNDNARDLTIVNSFFGKMLNSMEITGSISNIEGESQGNGTILIEMNNIEKEVSFNWEIDENNDFFLKTIVNVLDWEAESAFNFLNQECLDKHTGLDGKNKLWPDVEVRVLTTFKIKSLTYS